MSDTRTAPAFTTTNPATLELGKSYPADSAEAAARKVDEAAKAQKHWRRTGFEERAARMTAAAAVLRARRDELAALMTEEMGKPVSDGRAEVDKCASACEHFAAHAARYLDREDVGIEGDGVAAVTLTGSVAAGRSVAAIAGGVLKKCVLELGGSDAYVVLEDADIAAAARVCAAARMVNGGQSCIAGKRFIVVRPVRAAFEEALVAAMRSYEMGDPRDPATRLGPLQSVAARDEVHAQVEASVRAGARLLFGGMVPPRRGAWYPPTVLSGVTAGQPAHDQEVFGPVAAIIEAADESDAIAIANASEFGLGSGVLTRDLERGERIAAEELDAGLSFVNY